MCVSVGVGERERLTAFCPSTAQRIPSDAFARHARIMYVGSIYFTSTGTPASLKYFFVWQMIVDGYRHHKCFNQIMNRTIKSEELNYQNVR